MVLGLAWSGGVSCVTLLCAVLVFDFLAALLTHGYLCLHSYACVRSFPDTFGHRNNFVAATMLIVLFTVFALGSTTELVLNLLQIEMDVDENKYMENWHRERRSANLIRRFEEFVRRHVVRAELSCASSHSTRSSPGSQSEDNLSVGMAEDAIIYNGHIEQSEAGGDLDISNTASYGRRKRKESLFDYGSRS